MKLLLDTHTFLWAIHGDDNLSEVAGNAFINPDNTLYLSAVSYWEISIKQRIGKLGLISNWHTLIDQEMAANQIQWLPIDKSHCLAMIDLPEIHRDPFDLLLIAQAQCEGMTLVTKDQNIARYSVKTLW
ncbi:MAG: type II toxin-antitoxin system VapC family toxin [Pseudomonadota bacterium]